MDKHGYIYEITNEEMEALEAEDEKKLALMKEDMARLEGYLKGRADSDRPKRGKGANKDLAG
jgi:hypothetical protein